MTAVQLLVVSAAVASLWLCGSCARQPEEERHGTLVRLAELEIDPAHLDAYKAALKEEIDASLRLEPGVLILFAVSVKDQPAQVRIFETYASVAAYQAHLKTPHFSKYKTSTQHMVKSLRLIETEPIRLGMRNR